MEIPDSVQEAVVRVFVDRKMAHGGRSAGLPGTLFNRIFQRFMCEARRTGTQPPFLGLEDFMARVPGVYRDGKLFKFDAQVLNAACVAVQFVLLCGADV